MGLVGVPGCKLVQHGGNVLHAQQKILQRGRLIHRPHSLWHRLVLPDGLVAAGMLEEDRYVTARRPMLAKERAARAGAAQAVAEQNHRRERSVRGQIDAQRNIPGPRRFVNGQIQM